MKDPICTTLISLFPPVNETLHDFKGAYMNIVIQVKCSKKIRKRKMKEKDRNYNIDSHGRVWR